MVSKKHNLKSEFKTTMSAQDVQNMWSDDYKSIFRPSNKNLFKAHKVPKFKQRLVRNL